MRYVLCFHNNIQLGQVEIDEAEYFDLSRSLQQLVEVSDLEEKFNVVIDNYFEFERALLDETLRSMLYNEIKTSQFLESKRAISRRLINLLTAVRLYIDSLPQHACLLFEGEQLEYVNNAPSRSFDR